MNRQDLLRPSPPKNNNKKISLITNYNPNNPDLRSVLKNMKVYCYYKKPAIKLEDIEITYNKSPSIRDMVVKSSLQKQPITNLCQPCYKPRCKTCQQISTTQTITNQSNHSYKIRGNFNCQSTNIIYVLSLLNMWNPVCRRELKYNEYQM